MSAVLYAILLVACIALALPVGLLLLQVLSAWLPGRAAQPCSDAAGRIAVLVPAHDEALNIRRTVENLRRDLRPADRLLVVADNCGDDTAAIARAAGAEVVARHDPLRRGKGYALDFGLRHLASDPPDVVVIVDADCTVRLGSIGRVAAVALRAGAPAQAHYRMELPPDAGLKLKIAGFAWRVKNLARPLGYLRLGLPCQLMGSGMAFPWALIEQADLADAHLVEDLKLGLEFARHRTAPRFVPQAEVTSVFPASAAGVATQRRRWEHGHLGMLVDVAPRLLWQGLRTANVGLLALAVDLCIPPLALLALSMTAAVLASTFAWWTLGWTAPASIAWASCLAFALAVLGAWTRFGRDILSLSEMTGIPLYVLWKVPVYLRFMLRRERDWVRSARDVEK
ncbi:N-glycosyltransferase [mine drainage metagenome]|uniref:N-glycosyltransferase n=1 Tax=mine drainage metagenome TaxID=410659 RepID=A0A1J5RS80_9ZZZZ